LQQTDTFSCDVFRILFNVIYPSVLMSVNSSVFVEGFITKM